MPIKPPGEIRKDVPDQTGLGGRVAQWFNELCGWWADRLQDFVSNIIAWGLELILDAIGKGMGERLDSVIDMIAAEQGVPPEQAAKLKAIWRGEGEWQAALAGTAGGAATGGLISSTLGPHLKLLEYEMLRAANSARLDPGMAIGAEIRDPALMGLVESDLRDQGWTDERIGAFRKLARTLLDAGMLTRYKWRFGMPDGEYLAAMSKLGFDQAEAQRFEQVNKYYPPPVDLIRWQAREVFEPDMIARYGLDDELGGVDREPFYKAGMDDEQITNYWRAHWEHASWSEVREMFRRGLMEAHEVEDWFRVVEIPPFWRPLLMEIAWEVPTRVDIRRFKDMETIDDARLRQLYTSHGYKGQDLDDYILWTKVYIAFPDLVARYKNGWITLDQVLSELTALGMREDRAVEMIQTKIKPLGTERTTKERDLTKADIYKGVKKDVLTRAEGIDLLVDLGYDPGEADFILRINVPTGEAESEVKQRELTKSDVKAAFLADVISADEAYSRLMEIRYTPDDAAFIMSIYETVKAGRQEEPGKSLTKADITKAVKLGLIEPGEGFIMLQGIGYDPVESEFILAIVAEAGGRSPISYGEFKEVTQRYRQSQGLEAKVPSAQVIAAEKAVTNLKARIVELERRAASEDVVAQVKGELAEAEYRLRQLLIAEQ